MSPVAERVDTLGEQKVGTEGMGETKKHRTGTRDVTVGTLLPEEPKVGFILLSSSVPRCLFSVRPDVVQISSTSLD